MFDKLKLKLCLGTAVVMIGSSASTVALAADPPCQVPLKDGKTMEGVMANGVCRPPQEPLPNPTPPPPPPVPTPTPPAPVPPETPEPPHPVPTPTPPSSPLPTPTPTPAPPTPPSPQPPTVLNLGKSSSRRCVTNIGYQVQAMQPSSSSEGGHKYNLGVRNGLAPRTGYLIPEWRYTNSMNNMGPIKKTPQGVPIMFPGGNNHFQAVGRFGNSVHGYNYMYWAGSDWHEDGGSSLYFAKMGSRPGHIPFTSPSYSNRSNFPSGQSAPDWRDSTYRVMHFEKGFYEGTARWHAGGAQEYDGIIALALENGKNEQTRSLVTFIDVTNPNSPQRITSAEFTVPRHQLGGVGLTRNRDGRWLLATWWDIDMELRIYMSNSTDIRGGFDTGHYLRAYAAGQGNEQLSGANKYQTINFVNDCNGDFYIAGLYNTGAFKGAPFADDKLDLFKIGRGTGAVGSYRFTKVLQKQFWVNHDYAHFLDASGLYISPAGKLMLYTALGYRKGVTSTSTPGWLPFREYTAP